MSGQDGGLWLAAPAGGESPPKTFHPPAGVENLSWGEYLAKGMGSLLSLSLCGPFVFE